MTDEIRAKELARFNSDCGVMRTCIDAVRVATVSVAQVAGLGLERLLGGVVGFDIEHGDVAVRALVRAFTAADTPVLDVNSEATTSED